MRRISATLLLLAFFSFVSAPLLLGSADPYKNLPACCRRNGKHHCMMSMAERSHVASGKPEFRSLPEKCPFYPVSRQVSQHSDFGLTVSSAVLGDVISHPGVYAQTQSKWRIARERSRHKRGPPSTSGL